MSAIAFLSVLISTPSIWAQDQELVVRTAINPKDRALVGQRIEMQVDVLAQDIWANIPEFGRFDISGAIVVAPPNSSVRLNEQIRGDTFIGQRYELWIYPQRPGQLEIRQQQLNVQLKPYGVGQEPTFKQATTESFSVDVAYPEDVPAGANTVCATEFSAEQSWKPTSEEFSVGDGVTRMIIRTISDTPAMVLDPINTDEIAGVKLYVKQPDVADSFNRGALTGKRTDSVTYVFEQPGEIQLPNLRFAWWDLGAKTLRTIELDGKTLEIAPAKVTVAETSDDETLQTKVDLRRMAVLVAGLAAAVLMVVRYRQPLLERFDHWRQQIENSERSYFRRFVSTALANDPNQTLRALVQWLDVANDRDPAPRVDSFLSQFGDDDARNQVSALEAVVDSRSDVWNAGELVVSMKRARNRWLTTRHKRQKVATNPLPPMRTP